MKNKTTLRILFSIIAITTISISLKSQIVGEEAYMKGNYVEIGIDGDGGFEGAPIDSGAVPVGMNFRSNTQYFGFVANPQMDGWGNFDGDFFTPGSPENGWGFEIGATGIKQGNNCAGVNQIPGSIISWSHASGQTLCDWEGDATSGTNLHFKINYQLQDNDLFYITTVTITNNTGATLPELYYYRNLDPDNNVIISGSYVTTNTIISQPSCCGYAQVGASQSTPWNSYFEFLTDLDTNWRASYGGFANRDASDLWNGILFTQGVGSVNVADEAIAISYRIQNLAPGDSAAFKFCTVFDNSEVDCAISAMAVSQTPIPSVMVTTPAFALTGGSPSGGTYSGTGVIGGTTFDPSVSGVGDFVISYTYTDTNACVSVANTNIHVDMTTGISESINPVISIYPNPFSDFATIKLDSKTKFNNAQMHIYDVLGKEVKVISEINSSEIRVDRKGLSEGMYLYKFLNDGQVVSTGKLVVK